MLSVRDEMARLNIEPIFNSIYSPEFNPIEVVFSKAKHFYKKFKLQQLMLGNEIDIDALIRRAFRMVTIANCSNYIQHCHNYMRQKASE